MSGFVRDVAAGAVVGYALSSALDDPRKTMRKLVSGLLLVAIAIGMLVSAGFGAGNVGKPFAVIFLSALGLLWAFFGVWVSAKWFSKARVKTLRILHFAISSFRDSFVGRVFWIGLAVLWIVNIIVGLAVGPGTVAVIVKLGYLVCMLGLGWTIASLANLNFSRLFEVQELVARVLGWPQNTIDVVSTGSELSPQYTAVLPKLLEEAEAHGLAESLSEYASPRYAVGEYGADFIRLNAGRK